jgi:parallel beta-helix repeat protein
MHRNLDGVVLGGASRASIRDSDISENRSAGVVVVGSSEGLVENCQLAANGTFAVQAEGCAQGERPFTGLIGGSGNSISGSKEASPSVASLVCPTGLQFLMTEQGGELDLRNQ